MNACLTAATTTGGYGAALLETLLALAVVSALAWFVLRMLARRGALGLAGRARALAVEERLPLDLKNALWIVRVDDRRILVATGSDGPARLVTELPPAARDEAAPP